jgi:hypothetical protein
MHSFLFVMGSLRSPAIWNLIYPIAGSDISVSGANHLLFSYRHRDKLQYSSSSFVKIYQ